MTAECKRLNDGTGQVCSCSGDACALESTQRLLNKRRLGSFYLDDVKVLAAELERTQAALREAQDENERLQGKLRKADDALHEACLHQGLPEDAPPERIAAHFRNNREMREGWAALAPADEAKHGD